MRPLLPTLKERKRYIVYEVISSKPLQSDISAALLKNLAEKLGLFDSAGAGLLSVRYDKKTQFGILRCNHQYVNRVKAAMTITIFIGKTRVAIRTLGVSGVLAKTERFLPGKIQRQKLVGVEA